MKYFLFLCIFIPTSNIQAATIQTEDVQVELISVIAETGATLVQTNPRHSIQGLNCTSDFWLVLDSTSSGYDAVFSQLIAAQISGQKITVFATDPVAGSGTSCLLERVVTKAS